MPHFIAEYTDNISSRRTCLPCLKKSMPPWATAVCSRWAASVAEACAWIPWRMADGKHDYAFVHMTLKVGHGRDLATRQQVAEHLFEVITAHFAELQAQRLLALSFEMIELHEQLNFKEEQRARLPQSSAGLTTACPFAPSASQTKSIKP